jgi:hypothetical protein
MLLHPAHPRLEVADQTAMAEHGGMIFDDRPPQPDDLLARLLAQRLHLGVDADEIGRRICAQNVDFLVHARDIGPNPLQRFKDEVCGLLAQPSLHCSVIKMAQSPSAVEWADRRRTR